TRAPTSAPLACKRARHRPWSTRAAQGTGVALIPYSGHTNGGRGPKWRGMMNSDVFGGKWKQMRGQVKEWWGKLTDDDLDVIDGTMDKLAGALQERYGWEREEVDREIRKRFEQYEPERPARR